MRGKSVRIAQAAVVALLAGLLVPTSVSAQSTQTYGIQVGAGLFESPEAAGAPADGMRFYAPTTRVHPGDVVSFNFAGFHTATLLPANTDVQGWAAENTGTGNPWSFITADPDDEADAVKLNNAAGLPPVNCGQPGDPCTYDGTDVVNSGVGFFAPEPVFQVTIDANPGDVVWVICLVHPHMRFRLKVVDPADTTTSQAAIDAFREEKTSLDAEDARVVHDKLINKRTKRRTASGKVVWDAYSGFDGENWALLGMYPRKLVVRKGQTVRWRFSQLINEDHTVTLPMGQARAVFNESFVPVCDPDGDAGAGPDNPPDTFEPPFCNDPSQLEFDIPGDAMAERGDGIFNGDYQNSGIRGGGVNDLSVYDVKFNKVSSRKGFRYFCLIHGPFMDGRVRVKPRR